MSNAMDVDEESLAPTSEGNASSIPPESSDAGENLMDTQANDYREIAQLDTYEQTNIDDGDYGPADMNQRRAAEAEMNDRDGGDRDAQRAPRWAPQALMQEDEEVRRLRARRRMDQSAGGFDGDIGLINLEDYTGPLDVWIQNEQVEHEIKKRFRQFLTDHVDEHGNHTYPDKIHKMCRENQCSLEVSYLHLSHVHPVLGIWTADMPAKMLEYFDGVAMRVVLNEFPNYGDIHNEIHVRMSDLPLLDGLRDLRKGHLNQLIKTSGVVTRRTNVFPQLKKVNFDCVACGYIIGPLVQTGDQECYPTSGCPECYSKGPFKVNVAKTVYQNFQKLTIQETPGTVPAGRIPRSREIILTNDLCDSVRPGEEIHVTGIYQNVYDTGLNMQNGFPVFSTVIIANYISKKGDLYSKYMITDDDKQKIRELAKKPNIEEMLVNSIAPSIFGHQYIKRAICYCLFGGMEKNSRNKHRVRGDINILLMGDPGCGKSQFLKWTEKVAFRAVYATGKGASAVGLTASVRKDPLTGEWTLEGGALVLADRGVCMIDEFDKMNDSDRTSIHEAMEQQTISISKAGIVTTLQARCAVIAAANPIKGRYDCSMSFVENVDLTDPILSRFDILWVVRDIVDPTKDEQLADFVVGNHIRNHPNVEHDAAADANVKLPDIPQDLLRKYILYAKKNCKPKLHHIDKTKIANFYADLRQKSTEGGGIPIAVRHIESILRVAESRAKLHLREYVRDDDVDMAIRVVLKSFIRSQKLSVRSNLEREFQNYLNYQKDNVELLTHILDNMVNDETWYRQDTTSDTININFNQFKAKAAELNIHNLTGFMQSDKFQKAGFKWDEANKMIVKSFDASL